MARRPITRPPSPLVRYECYRCGADFPQLVPFCPDCLIEGAVRPAMGRARAERAEVHEEPLLTTARALAANRWTLVEVPACPGLRLLKGAFVLLYGPPGAGKSTLALKVLDSIEPGPVLAYLPEEGAGPAVGERLERLRIRRDDFHILARGSVDQFAAASRAEGVRAAVIDSLSVTPLQPTEGRELLQRLDLLALFGVLQVNKQGQMAGLKRWDHEADVRIRVDVGGVWTVEKSRFQGPPYPSGEVFAAETSSSTASSSAAGGARP